MVLIIPFPIFTINLVIILRKLVLAKRMFCKPCDNHKAETYNKLSRNNQQGIKAYHQTKITLPQKKLVRDEERKKPHSKTKQVLKWQF